MKKLLFLALTLFALFGQAGSAHEKELRVAVVMSSSSEIYQSVWESLQINLREQSNIRLEKISYQDVQRLDASHYQLFLAVGTQASKSMISLAPRAPVISALLTRSAYEILFADKADNQHLKFTAVVLDQPGARMLALAKALLPQAELLGGLHSANTEATARYMQHNASRYGLKFKPYAVHAGEKHARKIEQVLDENDVYITLPDAGVMTPNTAKWLLYMAYQEQVPVLTFSKAYVRAGALAAVYTSPQQEGRQAAELILDVANGKSLPALVYPKYFRVAINDWVAKSLDVSYSSETRIQQRVTALEKLAYD